MDLGIGEDEEQEKDKDKGKAPESYQKDIQKNSAKPQRKTGDRRAKEGSWEKVEARDGKIVVNKGEEDEDEDDKKRQKQKNSIRDSHTEYQKTVC